MTNIITKIKEWTGAFFPLTPDKGPQLDIVDRHSPLDVKKKKKKLAKVRTSRGTSTSTSSAIHSPESIAPYYEKMTKRQLEEYARKEFNVELDRRHNKKRMIAKIKTLIKE